jgi:hypothetical protein
VHATVALASARRFEDSRPGLLSSATALSAAGTSTNFATF